MSAAYALTESVPQRAVGRRMLLLLVAVLALPFVVAAMLILAGWRPTAAPHYGELLAQANTVAPLPLDALQISQGPGKSALAGRWLLVASEPDECTAACQARLDSLRRLHVALYKAMPRVRRVLLATSAPGVDQPDLTVALPTSWSAVAAADLGPAVTLVDPLGHAVLRYAPATEGFSHQRMLKDIERLLRYSWSG